MICSDALQACQCGETCVISNKIRLESIHVAEKYINAEL